MSVDAGARVAAVVAGVVSQAVADAGAAGIAVLDDGSPEARLAVQWSGAALGAERVWPIAPPPVDAGEALAAAAPNSFPRRGAGVDAAELHRLAGRLAALERNALLAHPANKTALLLAARVPPEPLLPLGDLYASEVERLAGGWTAAPEVVELADRAGGIAALDGALIALLDERRPAQAALAALPADSAAMVLAALEAGRFARRRIGLIPKLTTRTPGVDSFA